LTAQATISDTDSCVVFTGELQKSGGNYQHFLAELLSTTYDDETFSDVVLKAGQTRVRAHKHILAAQSPSFMAMFQVSARA